MRIMGNLAAKTLFRKVFQAKNTVLGKGLPKNRRHRDKQLEYYYLFAGSDNKIFGGRLSFLHTSRFWNTLAVSDAGKEERQIYYCGNQSPIRHPSIGYSRIDESSHRKHDRGYRSYNLQSLVEIKKNFSILL